MKMTARECVPATQPISHTRECVPCEIPPFCRNHYFTGKLLTERDLGAEQRYAIDKLRLHLLALHGWGVVCGLKVTPHPYCPQLRLVVQPGYAIDPCGYQILVPREVEIALPQPPPPRGGDDPYPAEPPYGGGSAGDRGAYAPEPSADVPSAPAYEPAGPPASCAPPLYVCLRYVECETEFMPAPFDECACNGDGQKPNRICEGYELHVTFEEPAGLDRIRKRFAECESDCKTLYDTLLESCPEPQPIDCIPLAVLRDYVPGAPVTEAMIDNLALRPLLPSTHLLDQLIRCLLDKLPVGGLTRITDLNWTHGHEYHCHDFVNFFVGDAHAPKAFEVTFEDRVRAEGLSRMSFRALIVRHAEKTEGGYLEVAPARVWASADGCKAYLQIDPGWVERCLHNIAFDVRLELDCDVVPNERGHPVDGELQARVQSDGTYVVAPPTGDGIAGGTFQSWIRVRA